MFHDLLRHGIIERKVRPWQTSTKVYSFVTGDQVDIMPPTDKPSATTQVKLAN